MNPKFTSPNSFKKSSRSSQGLKRFLAFVFAICIWIISIFFNVDGFNVQVPNRMWMAVVLGMVVTVIQLVGNSNNPKDNLTIFVLWVASYVYAIWTDVIGINLITNTPLPWVAVFAALIEFSPEVLLIWAINPDNQEGDFVGKLAKSIVKTILPPNSGKGTRSVPEMGLSELLFRKFPPKGKSVPTTRYNLPANERERLELIRKQLRQDNLGRVREEYGQ